MLVKNQNISLQMTTQEVKDLLGDPDDTSIKRDGISIWKYRAEGSNYQLFFHNDKLYDISKRCNETGNRMEFENEEGYFVNQLGGVDEL